MDLERILDLRSQCNHFRILVIGRPNAGKTTILKKVCNSIEDPRIYSPDGEKLDPSVIQGTQERGEHDIDNQLIFKSNPSFLFHDSRGFEAGSENEIRIVRKFIAERAQKRTLGDRLHAIWYCLPMDTNRPYLDAEKEFFHEFGSGDVPVIAIFTKFDGLETKVFGELRASNVDIKTAKREKKQRAIEVFTASYVEPLKELSTRPLPWVKLDDMHEELSNCAELISVTDGALSDDALKLLFASVQQNNIDVSIKNAVIYAFDEPLVSSTSCFCMPNYIFPQGQPGLRPGISRVTGQFPYFALVHCNIICVEY